MKGKLKYSEQTFVATFLMGSEPTDISLQL